MRNRNTLIVLLGISTFLVVSFLILTSSASYSKLKLIVAGNTLSFDMKLREQDQNISEKLGITQEGVSHLQLGLSEASAKNLAFLNGTEVNITSSASTLRFVTNILSLLVNNTTTLVTPGEELTMLPDSTFLYLKSTDLGKQAHFGVDLIDPHTPVTLAAFGKDHLDFAFIQKSPDAHLLNQKIINLKDVAGKDQGERTEGPGEGITQTQSQGVQTKSITLPEYSLTPIVGVLDDQLVIASSQEAFDQITLAAKDTAALEVGNYPRSLTVGWVDLAKMRSLGLERIAEETNGYMTLQYQHSVKDFLETLLKQRSIKFWVDPSKLLRGELMYE